MNKSEAILAIQVAAIKLNSIAFPEVAFPLRNAATGALYSLQEAAFLVESAHGFCLNASLEGCDKQEPLLEDFCNHDNKVILDSLTGGFPNENGRTIIWFFSYYINSSRHRINYLANKLIIENNTLIIGDQDPEQLLPFVLTEIERIIDVMARVYGVKNNADNGLA